jgi:hypothetical protein
VTACAMMRALELVFAVGWGAFWLYWIVAAFTMKRGRIPWSRELRIRAVIAVIVILLIRFGAFRGHGLNTNPLRTGLGLALFAVGLVNRTGMSGGSILLGGWGHVISVVEEVPAGVA